MVNNENPYIQVLPNIALPPANDDEDKTDREISDKPLWDLQEIVEIASRNAVGNVTIRMVTGKADRDYENLIENGFDLLEVLSQLVNKGKFKGAWWCRTSPAKGRDGKPRGSGMWVPCDAYAITMDFEHPTTLYRGKVEYYLKMCKSPNGSVVFFVSLHV
jgi:hypothetical protein